MSYLYLSKIFKNLENKNLEEQNLNTVIFINQKMKKQFKFSKIKIRSFGL